MTFGLCTTLPVQSFYDVTDGQHNCKIDMYTKYTIQVVFLLIGLSSPKSITGSSIVLPSDTTALSAVLPAKVELLMHQKNPLCYKQIDEI